MHNYTVVIAFIMLLILAVSIGLFNLEMLKALSLLRFWFTATGGDTMILLGLLLPLKEQDLESKSA
ncbi:hypothetical protein [Vibrio comitans]